MRRKSVLTLSTVEGTRSITVSRIIFPAISLLSVLFICGFAGGWFYSHYLGIKNSEIRDENSMVHQKYLDALSFSSSLSDEISALSEDLVEQADMMQKIGAIERLLKKKKSNDIFSSPALVAFNTYRKNKDLLARMNTDLDRRIRFLYALPSGTPLQQDTYISSGFGRRYHPVHQRLHLHRGIDMPLNIGDKVITTADGTVIFTGRKGGYGNTVIISHAYGFSTHYSHLDQNLVKVGDVVEKGEVIAYGGNTGISTGPHLHYEIRYMNKAMNPYHFYSWNLMNFENIFTKEIKVNWQEIIAAIDRNHHIRELPLSHMELN